MKKANIFTWLSEMQLMASQYLQDEFSEPLEQLGRGGKQKAEEKAVLSRGQSLNYRAG